MGRTCDAWPPNEIKKNTHPKQFTALFRVQAPRAGEPTHIINGGMGGSFRTAHFDAARERLFNVSGEVYHVGGSWGVAGQSESDGSILHIGWSSGPGGRVGPGLAMMSCVKTLGYDGASASLVANPAPFYSAMRNGTLVRQPLLTLGPREVYTPLLPPNAAASDLVLGLALPADASRSLAFEVRVLAAGAPAGNATSIMINVSASVLQGASQGSACAGNGQGRGRAVVRCGHVAVRASFADRNPQGGVFAVLDGETSLNLRVLTDRSIVEAFAMGGRGVAYGHDYPGVGDHNVHLVNWRPRRAADRAQLHHRLDGVRLGVI